MRAVAIVMLLCGGCSFLATSAPAAPPAPPDCVRSRFPPIADIGLAFFGLIGTELSAGLGEVGDDKASSSGLAFFVPVLAVATASSIYGFVRTSQCRDAYESRVGAPGYAPPAPPPGVPGPYPPPPAAAAPPPPPFPPPAQ
jgi:hypothetical protein